MVPLLSIRSPRVASLLFALVGAAAVAGTAQAAPLTATIVDAATGAPIDTASALLERGQGAGVDEAGKLVLELPPGVRQVTIIAPGYATRVVAVPAAATLAAGWVIQLTAEGGAEIIEVTGAGPERTRPVSYELTAEDIRTLPGAGNDVLRAVQSLPGVARIPYNFGGLVLRGQAPRDTSVFLDGIEVPLAFHFGGVTSFYPATLLEDLEVTSGGFDTGWGRTQGGVISLTTREARTDAWRVGGEVGLLHSGAFAEGPVPGGGGVMFGVRRSYLDALVRPFVEGSQPLPSYLDGQLRASWGDPRRAGRIIPQVFASVDRITSEELSFTSAFVRAGLTYRKSWGHTHLEVVPWAGYNTLLLENDERDSSVDPMEEDSSGPVRFRRPVRMIGARADLLHERSWGHLRAGLDAQGGHLGQLEINIEDVDTKATTSLWWRDLAGYAEVRLAPWGGRVAIKPGVRVESYGATDELVVDPRINLQQRLSQRWSLRQALGRYHQPPTPMELEKTLGNPNLKSAYTDQASLSVDARLPYGLTASATAFYHRGRKQPTAAVRPEPDPEVPEPNTGGLGPIFAELLEEQFGSFDYREATGQARTRGLELSLKRRAGRYYGYAAYSLAWAERKDDPTRFSGWRPYQLDQRHHLTLIGSISFTKWRLGGRMSLVSGNPYSPVTGVDENGEAMVREWGGRLPVFFALDVRADRAWKRNWGEVILYFDIQNATNRSNIEGRELDGNRQTDIHGLPILPFIGVEIVPRG